jgi:hypothetical protein
VIWYGTAGATTRVADATKPLWRRRADRGTPPNKLKQIFLFIVHCL